MTTAMRSAILVLFLCGGLAVLAACSTQTSIALKHPVEVEGMPRCSDCHTDGRSALDHGPDFGTRHRFFAAQQSMTCTICHVQSFCSDCHANKEELKPSDKYRDAPERFLPHQGDYLNQHKIDGKINPASCFPCHGRQNNERCKTCHR